jgi:hypothetical protein
MEMIEGNASPEEVTFMQGLVCVTTPLILPFLYWNSRCVFEVPNNNFALVISKTDKGQKTLIYGYFLTNFSALVTTSWVTFSPWTEYTLSTNSIRTI